MYHCTETLFLPGTMFPSCRTCNCTFHTGCSILILLKPVNNLRLTVKYWFFFHDRAVDLCNLYNKMSLFLTNAVLNYRGLGPMTHRTVDISDQWYFGLFIIRTNDPSDHWPLQDTSEYRPFGLLTIRTNGPSDCWPFGPMTLWTIDHSDQCLFGPLPFGSLAVRTNDL